MLKEKLENYLSSLTSDEIIPIHNRYCEYDNRMNDYVYYMEDLPELIKTEGKNAQEILGEIKSIYSTDRYLRVDGYGYVVSFNNWFDVFSVNDIVEYILRNDCDLDNIEIEAILRDEYTNDTDDEEMPIEWTKPTHDTEDDYYGGSC